MPLELPHALHRSTPVELSARLAAERSGRPFLLLRDATDAQRIVDLDDVPERLTVGRSLRSDLALSWDAEVSRVHARLERVGGEWTLVDDGSSRNGSSVDGEPVRGRRRLRDGDVIVLGRTPIVFRSPNGQESLHTAESRPPVRRPHVTAAQRRVLAALCRPCAEHGSLAAPASNQQIAAELVLGVETVKSHVHALFRAFELADVPPRHKRAALVRRALDTGLAGEG